MRIAAAQLNYTVGDLRGNADKIIQAIAEAREQGASLILFSELALCGYPPEDLLLLPAFVEAAEAQLQRVITATTGIAAIVGTVRKNSHGPGKPLFNTAVIIENGALLGFQDKSLLPTYDVFDERRYFEPALGSKLWQLAGISVAITICEDIWQASSFLTFGGYAEDPLDRFASLPTLAVNLAASPYSLDKFIPRLEAASRAAQHLHCPLLLCNQVGGNDSLIFDGNSFFLDSSGKRLQQAASFAEDLLFVELQQQVQPLPPDDPVGGLYSALVLGVRDYFRKSGIRRACLGLSGGIDSALVVCIAVEALGKDNVLAVSMPSRYTSEGSRTDARLLADRLGVAFKEISIEEPFGAFLSLLQPQFEDRMPDVTEENLQSRIRGVILMALSNKLGYLVLNTGNKSEVAMGYCTLYGDMAGGLAVLSDVTKGQVYALAHHVNRTREIIPASTMGRAPSAELRPHQKDSDTLPDYTLLDNVLRDHIEKGCSHSQISQAHHYPPALVHGLIQRIFANEFKRRQSPLGLRVTEKAFTKGRLFPIVQGWSKQ